MAVMDGYSADEVADGQGVLTTTLVSDGQGYTSTGEVIDGWGVSASGVRLAKGIGVGYTGVEICVANGS